MVAYNHKTKVTQTYKIHHHCTSRFLVRFRRKHTTQPVYVGPTTEWRLPG